MRRQSATIETASGTRAEVAVTLTAPSERQLVVIRSALAVRRICCAGLQSSATPVPLADIDLSYSPTLGQISGLFKLLPAPADRFRLR